MTAHTAKHCSSCSVEGCGMYNVLAKVCPLSSLVVSEMGYDRMKRHLQVNGEQVLERDSFLVHVPMKLQKRFGRN